MRPLPAMFVALALLAGCVSKGEVPQGPADGEPEGPAEPPGVWSFTFALDGPAESGIWALVAHFEQLARCQVTIEVSGVVEPDEMPAVVGAWRGKAGDSNWAGDTVRAAPSTYTTDSRLLEPFHAVGTTGFFWAASSPSLLVGEVACDGPFEPLARKAGATTVHSMASGVATPGVLGTGVATFHEEREGEHLVSFHGPIGRTTMRHADGELVYDLPSNPKLTGIYRGPITIEMAGAAAGHIVIADPQDVDRLPNESMLSRREPGPPAA